jgi:S1-C subfamily serine protease
MEWSSEFHRDDSDMLLVESGKAPPPLLSRADRDVPFKTKSKRLWDVPKEVHVSFQKGNLGLTVKEELCKTIIITKVHPGSHAFNKNVPVGSFLKKINGIFVCGEDDIDEIFRKEVTHGPYSITVWTNEVRKGVAAEELVFRFVGVNTWVGAHGPLGISFERQEGTGVFVSNVNPFGQAESLHVLEGSEIVAVENIKVSSYDQTVKLLKSLPRPGHSITTCQLLVCTISNQILSALSTISPHRSVSIKMLLHAKNRYESEGPIHPPRSSFAIITA